MDYQMLPLITAPFITTVDVLNMILGYCFEKSRQTIFYLQ